MGQRLIEVVELLVHKIHAGGYQQRALEDDIYAEKQKRIAAEKDRDHWMAARKDAIAAGELMQAEIADLRQQLADAKREASEEFTERQVLTVEQQQDAAAWQQKLDAAHQTITLQRQGIEPLRAFVSQVRSVVNSEWYGIEMQTVRELLAQLDAGTIKPTPVAEPLDAEGGA